MSKNIIGIGWVVATILFVLYSFTQVDLGLTLTRASIWQSIQQSFQYIGYFNRNLSGGLYIALGIVLFGMYFATLHAVYRKKLSRKFIWGIILFVSGALFVSYSAFSHDIFNYIFDAKIVTHYGENPYMKKALDFPGDPMLGFMHWTHRTYPYGPGWLAITVPISYVGLNFFLPTFYLFKLLMVGCFVGSVYFLEKILKKMKNGNPLFGMVFFALNPFVLSEFLVSAHNDIVMMFFALVSFYLLLTRAWLLSFVLLGFSISIKYATAFMIPVYLHAIGVTIRGKKINNSTLSMILILGMIVPVILASMRTNFQPWYLIYALPFASLFAHRFFVFIPSIVITCTAFFYYIPYIYIGNWDPPIPSILTSTILGSIGVSAVLIACYFLGYNYLKNKKS